MRVGDTVRRPAGPWTPAVHSLLRHLHASGLDAVPEVRGFDEKDREVLSYLPGDTVDVDAEVVSDALLADAVAWLRRFHLAVASFRPPAGTRWRNTSRPLEADEIVCHHDTGAYNWVVDGDRLVGMIDWDMAGPGRPIDDLAFTAWNSLPLFRELPLPDVVRRLRLMAATYGGIGAMEIVRHVDARMTAATNRIEAGQREGDPGMLNLARVGEPARTRGRLAALRDRLPEIERDLGA